MVLFKQGLLQEELKHVSVAQGKWKGSCFSKYPYISGLRLLYGAGLQLYTQLRDQLLAIIQRGFTFNSLFSNLFIF